MPLNNTMNEAALAWLAKMRTTEIELVEMRTKQREEMLKIRPADEVPPVTSDLALITHLQEMLTESVTLNQKLADLNRHIKELEGQLKESRAETERRGSRLSAIKRRLLDTVELAEGIEPPAQPISAAPAPPYPATPVFGSTGTVGGGPGIGQ